MFARKLLKNWVAAMTQVFCVSQQLISRSFLLPEMATESRRSLYLSCLGNVSAITPLACVPEQTSEFNIVFFFN